MVAIFGVALGGIVVGGVAIAQTPPAPIVGCVHNSTGSLRIAAGAGDCKPQESVLTWNRDGSPGSPGPPGPQGPPGSSPVGQSCPSGQFVRGISAAGTLECGSATTTTFFGDADGDGYGSPARAVQASVAPTGHVTSSGDCNDGASTIHPGALEVSNGTDDDCDGSVDENDGPVGFVFYADVDGDGFGDVHSTRIASSPPAGFVSNDDDCDDNAPNVHPGAAELLNHRDDNCNGQFDEGFMASLVGLNLAASSAPAGRYVTGTVTLDLPAEQSITIQLSSNNSNVQIPASLAVPISQSYVGFTVVTVEPGTATITAHYNGVVVSADLIVLP